MLLISSVHLVVHVLYFIPPASWTDGRVFRRMWASIECLERAQYLLGDVIIVWRAWSLWQDNLWARVFLAISLLGTACEYNILLYILKSSI